MDISSSIKPEYSCINPNHQEINNGSISIRTDLIEHVRDRYWLRAFMYDKLNFTFFKQSFLKYNAINNLGKQIKAINKNDNFEGKLTEAFKKFTKETDRLEGSNKEDNLGVLRDMSYMYVNNRDDNLGNNKPSNNDNLINMKTSINPFNVSSNNE